MSRSWFQKVPDRSWSRFQVKKRAAKKNKEQTTVRDSAGMRA